MRIRLLALVAVILMLASACLKVDMSIDVNDDGSGRIEGITAIDRQFIDLMGGFAEDIGGTDEIGGDLCAQMVTDGDFDTSEFDDVKPYDQGGFCGVEFAGDFEPGELENGGGALGEELVITRDGDNWAFNLPFEAATGDLSGGDDFGAEFEGLEGLFGDIEFKVKVRLPGRQVEHNGDSIDSDGFVVWDLDPTAADTPDSLFLRTEPGDRITEGGGGGGAGLIIAIIALVLIGLGVAAFFLMRKNNKGDASPASALAMAGTDGATAPAAGEWTSPSAPPIGSTAWGAPSGSTPTPPVDDATAVLPGVSTADLVPESEPTGASTPAPAVSANAASPTPEQATGSSVWDPVRNAYVQWDPNAGHWLVYDQAAEQWRPEA